MSLLYNQGCNSRFSAQTQPLSIEGAASSINSYLYNWTVSMYNLLKHTGMNTEVFRKFRQKIQSDTM